VGFRRRGRFCACRSLRPLGPGSCDGTFEYSAIGGKERVVFRHSQQIPEPCRGRTFRSERPGGAFGRSQLICGHDQPSAPDCNGHDKSVCDAARHRHPRFLRLRKREWRCDAADAQRWRLTFASKDALKWSTIRVSASDPRHVGSCAIKEHRVGHQARSSPNSLS
jgi:hypothetical protein